MGNASTRLDPERLLAESGWVRALAQSLVGASDVDDVVQETWRVALERPPRLDSSSSNLRGWLSTVMRNLVQRSRRGERMRADHAERVGRELASSESDAHERVLLQRHLADAVLQLGEPYKSAIVSRYFDGLSPREIAELQGISYDAARQRLSRGLAMLRARLDRDYGGGRATWSALCLSLVRRKTVLASPVAVVGGIAVSVKSLSAIAAALVLVVASWWWLRATSAGPADAHAIGAQPIGELAAASTAATNSSDVASHDRDAVSTGELTIDRDHDLHGVVLDPDGNLVASASVEVLRNEFCEFLSLDSDHKFDCTTVAKTTTSMRGEFAIALQPGRAFDLAVDAAGFAHASFEHCHAGERVEVHLERGSTLSGRVTRLGDDVPWVGARVELHRFTTNYPAESTPRLTTTTDELGRYRLQGLASGTYLASVFAARSVDVIEKLEIAPTSSIEHDFVLDDGRSVSGRVLDAQSGAPIANAEIDVSSRFERGVRSNSNGEFNCGDLSTTATLYVRAGGYGRTEVGLRRLAKAGDSLEIRMQRGRSVRGRLLDAHGAALADVYVAAVTYDQVGVTARVDCQSTRTANDGRFELADVRADMPHVLWIKKDELATIAYTFPRKESELAVVDFGDIRVAAAAIVQGVLVDETDAPFAHHVVHLRGWNSDIATFGGVDVKYKPKSGQPEFAKPPAESQVLDTFLGDRSTRTDDLGRFSFGDLAAGSYLLATTMPHAFHEVTLPLRIEESATLDGVRYVFPRGPTLEGRVVDSNGEPLYAILTCDAEGAGPQGPDGSCFTDARGHFKIEGLSPGAYRLYASPQPRVDAGPKTPIWLQTELHHVAAGTHDLELVCQRGGVIAGTVVDSNGEPMKGSQVLARSCVDAKSEEAVAETDAHGHFEFTLPDGQSYNLRALPLGPDPQSPDYMFAMPDVDPAHCVEVLGVATGGAPIVIRMP